MNVVTTVLIGAAAVSNSVLMAGAVAALLAAVGAELKTIVGWAIFVLWTGTILGWRLLRASLRRSKAHAAS